MIHLKKFKKVFSLLLAFALLAGSIPSFHSIRAEAETDTTEVIPLTLGQEKSFELKDYTESYNFQFTTDKPGKVTIEYSVNTAHYYDSCVVYNYMNLGIVTSPDDHVYAFNGGDSRSDGNTYTKEYWVEEGTYYLSVGYDYNGKVQDLIEPSARIKVSAEGYDNVRSGSGKQDTMETAAVLTSGVAAKGLITQYGSNFVQLFRLTTKNDFIEISIKSDGGSVRFMDSNGEYVDTSGAPSGWDKYLLRNAGTYYIVMEDNREGGGGPCTLTATWNDVTIPVSTPIPVSDEYEYEEEEEEETQQTESKPTSLNLKLIEPYYSLEKDKVVSSDVGLVGNRVRYDKRNRGKNGWIKWYELHYIMDFNENIDQTVKGEIIVKVGGIVLGHIKDSYGTNFTFDMECKDGDWGGETFADSPMNRIYLVPKKCYSYDIDTKAKAKKMKKILKAFKKDHKVTVILKCTGFKTETKTIKLKTWKQLYKTWTRKPKAKITKAVYTVKKTKGKTKRYVFKVSGTTDSVLKAEAEDPRNRNTDDKTGGLWADAYVGKYSLQAMSVSDLNLQSDVNGKLQGKVSIPTSAKKLYDELGEKYSVKQCKKILKKLKKSKTLILKFKDNYGYKNQTIKVKFKPNYI